MNLNDGVLTVDSMEGRVVQISVGFGACYVHLKILSYGSFSRKHAFQVARKRGWLSCFTSTETVGLLGTGDQDGHLDFHTAPEL